jgi:hypothetical protein
MTTPDKDNTGIRDMLNKIIEGKVSKNRKYVDDVLQKIQDQNHRYYLEKLVVEIQRMELEEKAGNLYWAEHHKVMAQAYKGILEKAFGITDLS